MGVVMRFLVAVLALAGVSVEARAAVVFDNGTFNSAGASNASDTLQAEDFVLGGDTDVDSFTFWTLEADGEYSGSVEWSIRQDSAGVPASIVSSGVSATATRTLVGAALGLSVFRYDVAIPVASLSSGVAYWLVLHNGPNASADFKDWYWAWTDLNATNTPTNRGREQELAGPAAWLTNDAEHAFFLNGSSSTVIPVPAAAILFGGVLPLLALRRKKRANDAA